MIVTKNININTLHIDSLKTKSLKVKTLNGVTGGELQNITGIKGNLQYQLDNLSDIAGRLKSIAESKVTDNTSL